MKWLIVAMAIVGTAHADTVAKYGANVPSDQEKIGRTKAIFISEQDRLFNAFIDQYEIGAWFDNSSIPGRKSSAMASYSMGININAGYLFAQALVGPALISTTDSNLGGHFQFNNDIGFGLRDPDTKATVGVAYKHLSSAGLASPNRGRDFLMFRISVEFN